LLCRLQGIAVVEDVLPLMGRIGQVAHVFCPSLNLP
jgi:hypothetical protein